MRLFIAVHFSPAFLTALEAAQDMLRQKVRSGNFTAAQNLHLTLAFIGEWPDPAAVRRALDRVSVPPFTLSLSGSERFGALYWAGLSRCPALEELARQVRTELAREAIPFDPKPFSPHITLARKVEAPEPVTLLLPAAVTEVNKLSLMSSRRINGKLVYTELCAKHL